MFTLELNPDQIMFTLELEPVHTTISCKADLDRIPTAGSGSGYATKSNCTNILAVGPLQLIPSGSFAI